MQHEEKICKNCIAMKKGECIGKQNTCEDYRYAPSMTEEKKNQWPKYGDATAFRIGKPKR